MSDNQADILNILVRRVNSFAEGYRQNIAVIGEPYIGKTSLVKSLLTSQEIKRDLIIPIYLEVKIEPFEFTVKRFIKSSLYQLLQSDPFLTASYDTVLLMDDLKRNYPKTAQICIRVMQDIEKSRAEEAYSFMLDIPAVIFEETGKRCVLVLDEFHNLDNFSLKHPYGTLAKKIMLQKDTMFLLLSSKSTVSHRLLNEKLSMLFGNFEKITLPPLGLATARSFLHDNITCTDFPPVYLDFIASFCGNKVFYMQLVCDEIERAVLSKRKSSNDYTGIVECALENAVFKKTGVINQHFFNFFFKASDGKLLSKTASVLIALSSENRKQLDIAKSTKMQSRDISRILNKLIEMDIIARNGSLYRFKDRLFSFWLQSVYLKRILSTSIDEILEENSFKKEILSRLDVFMQEFKKELSSRITDLFRLFKNDVIQLNGRKHKFSAFNEVQNLDENFCNSTNILASGSKARWLCTIRTGYVTESDVGEIIKNIKGSKQYKKINRHILVSLSGINENAYLLAKDSKLWVWGVEDVNVLMELYGKPNIA